MINAIKLSSSATHEFWEIPVLYEDPHLLALNKPAGLLLSPDPHQPECPSLMKLLHEAIDREAAWSRENGRAHLAQSHRLDAEASGVLLLAKSKAVMGSLMNLFGTQEPSRTFVALVQGSPPADEFKADAKLAPHPARAGLMHVDAKRGKRSVSVFQVRERFAGWTLLQCAPLTDRPHQIRVHLRRLNLPVAGDRAYGGRPLLLSRLKQGYRLKPNQVERPLVAAPALHAEAMNVAHPVTGVPLTITAPWPKDLTVAVKYLRRFAAA